MLAVVHIDIHFQLNPEVISGFADGEQLRALV